MIPFLVADRPASLRIIRGSKLQNYNVKSGIMTHANTTDNFHLLFKSYPCVLGKYCEVISTNCPYNKDINRCSEGKKIMENTVKICDSGIFQKHSDPIEYLDLFNVYDAMKTEYGVINDVLKDKKLTLESAEEAFDIYEQNEYNFKLVGVSQGKSLGEYIACYDELKKIGYQYIAIGGLLKKRVNSARYVTVKDGELLLDVIKTIRKRYKHDWVYVLGCYHLKRHEFFAENSVFGSDFKGWIFQYDIGRGEKSNIENSNKQGRQRSRFTQVRNYLRSLYSLTEEYNKKHKPIHY